MKWKDSFHQWVKDQIVYLETFISSPWYSSLICALAAADIFIFVIPTDGLMLSSVLIRTKKWVSYAVATALGSSIGAALMLVLLRHYGFDLLEFFKPEIQDSSSWQWTLQFFDQYGLVVLFLSGLSPFMPLPILAMVAFTKAPISEVVGIYFMGRILKNLILCYLASHTPRLLSRIWGIQGELKEVGSDTLSADKQ